MLLRKAHPDDGNVETVNPARAAGTQFAREQMLAQNVLARRASAEGTPE